MDLYKKIKTIKLKKQNGYSLVELILVLAISSIAFLGVLGLEKRKAETQNAENAGTQIAEVGQALGKYINQESTLLKATIPVGSVVTIPFSVLTQPAGNTGVYPNHLFLPTTYKNTTLLGVTLKLQIKNNVGNILTGLVLPNNPVIDASGAVRNDYIGLAIKKMGAQGGMTFPNATVLSGLGGQWSLTNAEFPDINQVGLFGYRVGYQSDYDSVYLRLDGTYPMKGNLDMGNYSIRNATDISYNGWIYGNNAVFNNIITGTITNSGNIQTNSINGTTTGSVAAAVTNAGNKPYANFDLLYSNCINCGLSGEGVSQPLEKAGDVRIGSGGDQGRLFVNDIVLGENANRPGMNNAYLSDRLGRYVDRGIALVSDDQVINKPVCKARSGYNVNAKVEVIPQITYLQGRVLGDITLHTYLDPVTGYTSIYATQDLYSVSGIEAYATDLGTQWRISIKSPDYGLIAGAQAASKALAHVYCDYT